MDRGAWVIPQGHKESDMAEAIDHAWVRPVCDFMTFFITQRSL